MKKFELTSEFITNAFGVKLFRIRAAAAFWEIRMSSGPSSSALTATGSWRKNTLPLPI